MLRSHLLPRFIFRRVHKYTSYQYCSGPRIPALTALQQPSPQQNKNSRRQSTTTGTYSRRHKERHRQPPICLSAHSHTHANSSSAEITSLSPPVAETALAIPYTFALTSLVTRKVYSDRRQTKLRVFTGTRNVFQNEKSKQRQQNCQPSTRDAR